MSVSEGRRSRIGSPDGARGAHDRCAGPGAGGACRGFANGPRSTRPVGEIGRHRRENPRHAVGNDSRTATRFVANTAAVAIIDAKSSTLLNHSAGRPGPVLDPATSGRTVPGLETKRGVPPGKAPQAPGPEALFPQFPDDLSDKSHQIRRLVVKARQPLFRDRCRPGRPNAAEMQRSAGRNRRRARSISLSRHHKGLQERCPTGGHVAAGGGRAGTEA
ncbi:hypothetical protein ROA7023_02778 [Roseisalinus antarcticus]|uniref:Uncharacterized protein n=1 Tax=Roseisalinus antarcticus TaxID=254357 RepID=A0A1Y5TGW8_9RHOB|nr:hypothetical protein ROA7023_02778 [Roseisalinus antarcticus]